MRSLRSFPTLLALATAALGCHASALDPPIADEAPVGTEVARPTEPPGAPNQAATTGPVLGDPGHAGEGTPLRAEPGHALAAFAAGCFWGVEDAFRKLPGVTATAVGYAGGHVDHPTYERVCDHDTGHAETVLVEYDPQRIAYEKLLRAFFQIHDPTQLNRQGPDVGDQYRSEIFTFDDAQAREAQQAISAKQKAEGARVVTRIEPMPAFWKAEEYHQQYAEKNGFHGCPTGKLDGLL
jgi:peptide-methionine (S)-S-oxide reductase